MRTPTHLMRSSAVGRTVVRVYEKSSTPGAIDRVVRFEGGEMYSLTLRKILQMYYQVTVGSYSYGSLLRPGAADRCTQIGRYVSIGPGCEGLARHTPSTSRACIHSGTTRGSVASAPRTTYAHKRVDRARGNGLAAESPFFPKLSASGLGQSWGQERSSRTTWLTSPSSWAIQPRRSGSG